MNGAEYVINALQQYGITTIFGYPGGQIMPFYDALYKSKLTHILCRHEQGAAMAAIGYARASGQVGVCVATSGPGATNLITGLADALLDSIPIIAITGQVPTALIGTDAFQEVDVIGLSLACTKHSFLVESLDDLPAILQQAFHLATNGRPGPVLIDLPKNIQISDVELPFLPQLTAPLPNVHSTALTQASHLIQQAKKPILYIGGGVDMAHAIPALRDFMATTGIPCVSTLKGLGAADPNSPLYLGLIGMHGTKVANHAVQQSDLLIAVGVRFDDRVTGNLNTFASQAKVIHIDIDPAEMSKLKRAHSELLGDITTILTALQQPLSIDAWRHHILLMKSQNVMTYHPTTDIDAPTLLNRLSMLKTDNTIITTDVGQHQMWAAQHLSFTDPKNFITSSGLGSMGFGLPAAIGAQLVRPHDPVICISGDGSFMMNIQELTTIKRKKLPIKILLLDNERLGMVRQWQQLFFEQRYSETDLSDNPDFLLLAQSFGIEGQTITQYSQIESALTDLLQAPNAYLLHVKINQLDNVWPLVPPGASNEHMLEATSC